MSQTASPHCQIFLAKKRQSIKNKSKYKTKILVKIYLAFCSERLAAMLLCTNSCRFSCSLPTVQGREDREASQKWGVSMSKVKGKHSTTVSDSLWQLVTVCDSLWQLQTPGKTPGSTEGKATPQKHVPFKRKTPRAAIPTTSQTRRPFTAHPNWVQKPIFHLCVPSVPRTWDRNNEISQFRHKFYAIEKNEEGVAV